MPPAPETATRTPFRVRAKAVEACSCAHGCNCQFGGTPNEGICEFVIGYEVEEGRFGTVDLRGVRAAVAAKYPNAIHEGHGHVVLFVDERASPDQVSAFASILSGKFGGMPWEALAGTIERFEGPIALPFDLRIDGQRAHLRFAGRSSWRPRPCVTRSRERRRRSTSRTPRAASSGTTGTSVTTSTMRVTHESLRMEWPSKYASTAEVNWTNGG